MLGRLGVALYRLGVAFGVAFSDTNMLVSPTRNHRVGGLNQREDPTRVVSRRSEI